jgi:hypothetical protein
LAFSLQDFPNFTHIFFIGILFVEFAFVIKALLRHARRTRKQIDDSPQDAPPVGAIIQGASNWEGSPESPGRFDLEEIGVVEALKPVPPAYGVYRGSVRIADTDITFFFFTFSINKCRWVRRNEMSEHQIEATLDQGEAGPPGRPPSYGPEGRV